MSNRFDHLKKKSDKSKKVDDFIEGANAPREGDKIAKQQRNTSEVLLSAPNRIDYETGKAKPVLLTLRQDIADDLEKYCHGNKQAIINYLVERGLQELIKDGELILL